LLSQSGPQLGSFLDMAFARLFPINATNAQDGDRTFSERLGLSDDASRSSN